MAGGFLENPTWNVFHGAPSFQGLGQQLVPGFPELLGIRAAQAGPLNWCTTVLNG